MPARVECHCTDRPRRLASEAIRGCAGQEGLRLI
jgi:hypothetical protein